MTEPGLQDLAASSLPEAADVGCPTGIMALAILERPFAILNGPPPSQGVWGWPDLIIQTVSGVITMPGDLIDVGGAALSNALLPPGLGFPAARLLVSGHLGLPHMHAPPPAPPMMGAGPSMLLGAISVLAGNVPMLRTGDVGIAPTCAAPVFRQFTGSATVFIGGKRAVRLLDITEHCPLVRSSLAGTGPANAATHIVDSMTLAAAATGVLAHGAAAAHYFGEDDVPEEVVEREVAGEVAQAVLGVVQGVGDAAVSAMHNLIGLPPPIASCGAGLTIPLGTVPLVLIGGLPMPDLGSLTNAYVARWARNLRALAIRAGRRRAGGCSWHGAVFGEPVDAVTGHVFADHLDVDLGGGLAFGRHYDTRARDRIGDCGRGTRHTYERELEVWLHRCSYVDHDGTRVDFPAFRGRTRIGLDGYVIERRSAEHYEVTHGGETMTFVATPGERGARLVAIRSEIGTRVIERDEHGRFCAVRLEERALLVTRDQSGHIAAVRDERGLERAAYAYERGCLSHARNATGGEERFTYDDAHRLVAWCDARGYRFAWRYDAQSRCIHTSGQNGQWSCDFAYEKNRTTVTHGSGLSRTLYFDAYGTVLRVTRSDGSFLLREQDASGRIVRERDAAGRVVELVYDDDGGLVARRDRFGNLLPPQPQRDERSALERTLPGRHIERLGLEGGGDDGPAAIPEALVSLGAWALPTPRAPRAPRVEHDDLGRVARMVDPDGRVTELRRDGAGNVVEQIDRDRRVARTLVTGWNLVGSTIDPIGRRIDVTHTSTEEARTYRDPLGALTEYGRDAADRMTSVTRAGRLRETYAYDAGDRLVEKRDASGSVLLTVSHGANALPARIALAEGGTIALEYDARGRVTRAALGEHDARLERDADRVVLFDRVGETGLRRWRFGARETTVLFERFETSIERAAGRLVVRDPTGRLSSFALGRGRVMRHLANGTQEILAFDPEGRLEGRLAHRMASDGALRSWAVRYDRSGEGDLLGVWDTARGQRRFEIDDAHRLEAELDERGAHQRYAHDACDNVVAKPGVAHAELTGDSVLVRTDAETFEHDARSRLALRRDASGRETRYGYDSLDQLVRVELPTGERWRGSYDGLGRLRRFGVAGRETTLFWDGDRIAAELASSGALRIHVYSDARALIPFAFVDYASVEAEPESGRAYFVFHDASGMPLQIEDTTGATVWWANRVDPYGAITLHEGAELDYALRWPGHYFDADLGLHHNRFRAYDPHLARYLQPDPIGHAGSPHSLYAYAANPLVAVDLLGLHTGEHPAATHHTDEPTEGHPLAEFLRRNALGRLFNVLTGRFVVDPEATGDRRPTIRSTRIEITDGHEARLDPHTEPVRSILARRGEAERAAAAADARGDVPARERARAAQRRETEALGDLATDAEVRSRYPDAELLHEGRGPGTFDRVYSIPGDPPRTLVAEAKGGRARESSSRRFGADQVQQGSPEYRASTALDMSRSSDAATRDAGRAVLTSGDDTIYMCVTQPVDSGGLGSVRVFEYGDSQRVSDGATSTPGAPRGPPPRRASTR